jgi:hypothetical protein
MSHAGVRRAPGGFLDRFGTGPSGGLAGAALRPAPPASVRLRYAWAASLRAAGRQRAGARGAHATIATATAVRIAPPRMSST